MRPRAIGRVARTAVAMGVAMAVPLDATEAQMAPISVDSALSNPALRGVPAVRPRFIVALYGWIVRISGETGVRDLSADVDITFGELLSHLRFAAMGTFEAHYGPWLGTVDGVYASLRADRTREIGPLQTDLDMKLKMFVGQAFAGYSFVPAPDVAIDVLAGARLWAVEASLKREGVIDTATRSRSPTWADALGGLRVRWRAAERWNVSAEGDGGGGGSKGTGGAIATVGYDVAREWSVFAAYRYLYVNYRKNEYFFNGNLHGPVIGGAYRW